MFSLLPHRREDDWGIEAMHVMRKGQVKRLDGKDVVGQAKLVGSLFGVVA
jgi:hypothetical protein